MLNEMIMDILTNQTIMKYVVYDFVDKDPLDEPDIQNPQQYLFNPRQPEINTYRIYQIPKIPTAEEIKKTVISAHILKTKTINNNPFYKDYIIVFDVISHIELWGISGGKIRPLEIADEINNIYNQKYSTNSMKNLFPLDDSYIKYNDVYYGYRLLYDCTAVSSTLCK